MDKQITIIIDGQTFERVRMIAANQGGRSVSSVIRQILAAHVLGDNSRSPMTAVSDGSTGGHV